jgi:hypothetical protein
MLPRCPDRASLGVLLDDFHIRAGALASHRRPPKQELETWTIMDDWPEHVPITQAEADVFEAWFGDLLDQLFGPPDESVPFASGFLDQPRERAAALRPPRRA